MLYFFLCFTLLCIAVGFYIMYETVRPLMFRMLRSQHDSVVVTKQDIDLMQDIARHAARQLVAAAAVLGLGLCLLARVLWSLGAMQ